MAVSSTIAKTFKRFVIPRSKSSIDSFTTSNSTAASIEQSSEESISPSNGYSLSHHKHPPLSYVQHFRPTQHHSEQNLSFPSQQQQEQQEQENYYLPTRPLSGDISSFMMNSTSTNEYIPKKANTNINLSTNNNNNNHPQQNPLTTDLVDQHVQIKSLDQSDSISITRPNTTSLSNTNNNTLKPISEEDNIIPINQENRLNITYDDLEDNTNRSDSGTSTHLQIQKTVPSLSVSSSSSLSAISTTNKHSQSQQQDNTVKSSKSSSSLTSNIATTLSVLPNNKSYLTNSISLHENVNTLMNNPHLSTSITNNKRIPVHQTKSLTNEIENTNINVKMRDHSNKKKNDSRDLKSRISLPPESKNIFTQRTNNIKSKLTQRSSYYQTNCLSSQTLNTTLNQSNISLSIQNNSTISYGQLSRNEHRLSMLDLGYGKIESYTKLEKLGEGTYATVYKGTSIFFNGYIALKEIRLEQEEGAPCTALREVSLLKGLKHSNIVSLYDIIFDKTTLTLVFEYVEKDLKQYMEDCGNILNLKNVSLFLFQLLRGLEFCHSKKILHRDLKPQNLLINERGELKLADFGLARIKSFPTKTYSHEVVTLWYRPPDVLLGSTEYSTPIDIWAVGCIFYEMACGRPLFAGTKVDEELYLIFKYLGTPTEQTLPGVTINPDFQALNFPYYYRQSLKHLAPRLDPNGIDLLEKFLRYNPQSRISAHDAMMHKYFSFYPSEIHTLEPLQSILDLNEICLTKDYGSKLLATSFMKTTISKRSSVHL